MNRILIIEDEDMTAKTVKKALELNGMAAEIGQRGIQMIKEKDYDLILLDLKMPKVSGENVLRVIREVQPYVFVIVYTNFREFTDIKALVNIGIDGYVNKGADADLQSLVDMIKEKLQPFSMEQAQKIIETADIGREG